jgi:hypothetical protein
MKLKEKESIGLKIISVILMVVLSNLLIKPISYIVLEKNAYLCH